MAEDQAAEIRALRDALTYARSVIENYEADIRGSEWVGVDLVAKGFCQGDIYVGAVERIDRLAARRN